MNERKITPSHSIPALFVFLLLGLFALFSLILVMFGAQAYRHTIDHTAAHNNRRVLSAYIRNNLQTGDIRNGISFNEKDIPRLEITDAEDTTYVKYIFVYEGQLCELYTEKDNDFNAEAGEPICPADSISAKFDDGLITVFVTAEDAEHVTVYAPRCEEDRT